MPKSDKSGPNGGADRTVDRDSRWHHVVQQRYEPDRDGGLTTAIVFALADAEGVAPTEMTSPTLYDAVDATGIEQALFGSGTTAASGEATGTVEFRYADYLVNVESDGWIHVYEPTRPERP
ncbi:MAG: HalOD1 output domain-containing protein [Halorubrum sp.]|uniref:HalOD1 output domain-containing protein n=1 Tax=Halorubrum sp. TaxID=1879286 RepID=UPI003970A563